MNRTIQTAWLLAALLLLTACSTKKNTWLTRNFHALTTRYNIAFNGNDVLSLVFLNGVGQSGLGLMAGGSHDRVVVVETDHVEHHVRSDRVEAANEGFRAAGAFKPMQPHNRRARLGLHGLSNFLSTGAAQPEACSCQRTELQKASTADALTPQRFILRLKHVVFSFA